MPWATIAPRQIANLKSVFMVLLLALLFMLFAVFLFLACARARAAFRVISHHAHFFVHVLRIFHRILQK